MLPKEEQETSLLIVHAIGDQSPIAAVADVVESGTEQQTPFGPLTHIALRDPYLREQLDALHTNWAVRPPPATGLLARVRTRLAWWLLGRELHDVNSVHATLVRVIDTLVVQLDQERAARRRIEEHLATTREQP